MKKLLLVLFFPVMLWAGELTVKTPAAFVQPPGTIDRVSKRTANSKTFELDHIGSGKFISIVSAGPMHYLDSAGTYRDYDFDAKASSLARQAEGFDKTINTGRFVFEYSTATPGKMRYTRRGSSIEFAPAFDTKDVGIKFDVTETGIKSTYTLKNKSAPNRLIWTYTSTAPIDSKSALGGADIKTTDGGIIGFIKDFSAFDAFGKAAKLTVSYNKDSLIALVDTTGLEYPVFIDPTVQDTALPGSSGRFDASSASGWLAARDLTAPTVTAGSYMVGRELATHNARSALSFDLVGSLGAQVVDSVRLFWYDNNGVSGADTLHIEAVLGTFATSAPADAWYNDFAGWQASGAYTPTYLTDDPINILDEATAWHSTLFSAEGCDSVEALIDIDTLRVMLLSSVDISGDSTTWHTTGGACFSFASGTEPYLAIYYNTTAYHQPGVTSHADTAYGMVIFTGEIDSTGGENSTIRGFKYNLSTGDTTSIFASGSFGTGVFSLSEDSLIIGEEYFWRAFAANSVDTSYGAVKSFTIDTTGTGGTSGTIYIDGRVVDIVR